jgi:hypothetical protein
VDLQVTGCYVAVARVEQHGLAIVGEQDAIRGQAPVRDLAGVQPADRIPDLAQLVVTAAGPPAWIRCVSMDPNRVARHSGDVVTTADGKANGFCAPVDPPQTGRSPPESAALMFLYAVGAAASRF